MYGGKRAAHGAADGDASRDRRARAIPEAGSGSGTGVLDRRAELAEAARRERAAAAALIPELERAVARAAEAAADRAADKRRADEAHAAARDALEARRGDEERARDEMARRRNIYEDAVAALREASDRLVAATDGAGRARAAVCVLEEETEAARRIAESVQSDWLAANGAVNAARARWSDARRAARGLPPLPPGAAAAGVAWLACGACAAGGPLTLACEQPAEDVAPCSGDPGAHGLCCECALTFARAEALGGAACGVEGCTGAVTTRDLRALLLRRAAAAGAEEVQDAFATLDALMTRGERARALAEGAARAREQAAAARATPAWDAVLDLVEKMRCPGTCGSQYDYTDPNTCQKATCTAPGCQVSYCACCWTTHPERGAEPFNHDHVRRCFWNVRVGDIFNEEHKAEQLAVARALTAAKRLAEDRDLFDRLQVEMSGKPNAAQARRLAAAGLEVVQPAERKANGRRWPIIPVPTLSDDLLARSGKLLRLRLLHALADVAGGAPPARLRFVDLDEMDAPLDVAAEYAMTPRTLNYVKREEFEREPLWDKGAAEMAAVLRAVEREEDLDEYRPTDNELEFHYKTLLHGAPRVCARYRHADFVVALREEHAAALVRWAATPNDDYDRNVVNDDNAARVQRHAVDVLGKWPSLKSIFNECLPYAKRYVCQAGLDANMQRLEPVE